MRKADLGCSAADLVYGSALRLPGDFIDPAQTALALTPASYADQLRRAMEALRPTAPRRANNECAYIPSALSDATHVFVRHDAVKPPLACPYDGPYRVAARTNKTITVERGSRLDEVSIDRVKPAHLERPTAPSDPAMKARATVAAVTLGSPM